MARILVIEDNPENLELMTYLFRAYGHDTLVASDGAEGLAAARRNHADLIVCDVHLPKKDGYEIAHELKRDPLLRMIPLVAVTALAMVGDRDKLLGAGFDGYIAKPIDPQQFVRQIEGFLPASEREADAASTRAVTESMLNPSVPVRQESRARILVVDDSAANRELTRAVLEPFGYTLTVASSVKAALALAAAAPFDLILSDMHMPLEDGLNLLAAAKADPRLRDIPFMVISSSARASHHEERALKLGAARFVLRPIEPEQLLEEVAGCLGRRRSDAQAKE